MNFDDDVVNRKDRYALGRETESGRFYMAIPCENRQHAGYDECYEITPEEMERFKMDRAAAAALANRCRRREEDTRLFYQPSIERGIPV